MSERRRPPRRGRGQRPYPPRQGGDADDPNPYRDSSGSEAAALPSPDAEGGAAAGDDAPPAPRPAEEPGQGEYVASPNGSAPAAGGDGRPPREFRDREFQAGRRGRRNRGRGPRREGGPGEPRPGNGGHNAAPPAPVVATGETRGWYDTGRDGGYVRRAEASYLAESGDAFVPPHVARQYGLRRGDLIDATTGRDHRGRTVAVEIRSVNGLAPDALGTRPEFTNLPASYPDRKLTLETGRPARGAELTRRAIDLIAPIGYGQRALIVAPARAGKTTLLHAITEGVSLNHPEAALLILLVDERPEEVSEAISWEVGEVISSSFDQPAQRHVEVTEIVLERARRLVEMGKDVVIVLDSLTRMARAHNTAERGTGRTLSGGLDAQAMAKPKAFFGSARAVSPAAGGGSLTIIATALVETGSRMDDVIFEEFKGTGNCEIKLDRPLAEKRIFPAIDIATSGTRREEKLFRPEQLDAVYALRRGLSQMPPQAAMEWLIKRIGATPSNDTMLAGLLRD